MPFNIDIGSNGVFIYARREIVTDSCRTAQDVDAAIASLKAKLDTLGARMKAEIKREQAQAEREGVGPFNRT